MRAMREKMSEANTLLKRVPVARDENGYFMHPDLAHFWDVEMEGAEGCTPQQWEELETRAGSRTRTVFLESEPLDHPAYVSYFDNDNTDITEWDPSPPPNCWLIQIGESEDGPFAVWATHKDAPVAVA